MKHLWPVVPKTASVRVHQLISTAVASCLVYSGLLGCHEKAPDDPSWTLPPLSIQSYGPQALLPTSTLHFRGAGFLPVSLGHQSVHFTGTVNGEPVDWSTSAQWVSPDDLTVNVAKTFTWSGGSDGTVVTGKISVTRTSLGGSGHNTTEIPVEFSLHNELTPTLASLGTDSTTNQIWPGDVIEVVGNGFLLSNEGTTSVLFFDTEASSLGINTDVNNGLPIVTTVLDRQKLFFYVTATPFGIKSTKITGTLMVQNHHAGGQTTFSDEFPVTWVLKPPNIGEVYPKHVSRGQVLQFVGRGFLPPEADSNAATIFALNGQFVPTYGDTESWTHENELLMSPSTIHNGTGADYVLSVGLDVHGRLTGLGVNAGTFRGTITPYLLYGTQVEAGESSPLELTVLPQLQVVWLRFLPGYYTALEHFGLVAVEKYIRQRIFDVCKRDYAGINIRFVDKPPQDFAEYSVVEIGGKDPNGAFLFGLDNTQGKDTGNVRFTDVVGGLNAETEEDGYYGYGGVFVESFLALSPTFGFGALPIQNQRFDDIFALFVKKGGGQPVSGNEYPDGPRAIAIAEAIRVLGNLVGSTITHEVGHTLGLTNIPGEFHNIGDNPGWIMDSGIFRPFEERAEIDGQGPGVFSPFNREYLETILPTRP